MPNGRPGDNPYTDIITHDKSLYNEEVRVYVRRVDEYGEEGAEHLAFILLWNIHRDYTEEELDTLEGKLLSLCRQIERASEYSEDSPLKTVLHGDEDLYNESIRRLIREIYEEIHEKIDNTRRGRLKLSGLLWTAGWMPDDLDAVEADLRDFRENHWVWEK